MDFSSFLMVVIFRVSWQAREHISKSTFEGACFPRLLLLPLFLLYLCDFVRRQILFTWVIVQQLPLLSRCSFIKFIEFIPKLFNIVCIVLVAHCLPIEFLRILLFVPNPLKHFPTNLQVKEICSDRHHYGLQLANLEWVCKRTVWSKDWISN